MKKLLGSVLLVCAGIISGVFHAEGALKKTVEPFKNNERVVFFGDSITHGGSFHSYALLCQALRYPASRVYIYNGGISGGTSGGGFARIDEDILSKKPQRVFIMFGMNDVGINLYNGKEDAKTLAARAKRIANYKSNMDKCIAKFLKNKINVVLITPTPYDEYTAKPKARKWIGANEKGLAACAAVVRELAAKYKLPVVDFFGPQTAIAGKGQGIFHRVDRVHPNQYGHYVMGAMLLEALGEKPVEMKVVLNGKTGKFTAKNVKVTQVKTAPGLVSFHYAGKVLPFVSNPAYMKKAQEIYPVMEAFNNEKLAVTGLAPGRYQVRCGKRLIGTFTEKALARGLDLAALRTPAYDEGAKVSGFNNRIYSVQSRLRGIVMMRNIARRNAPKGKCSTMQEEFAALDKFGSRSHIRKNKYYQNMIKSFKQNRPREEKLKKELESLFGKLYDQAAKKISFPVVIRKVK